MTNQLLKPVLICFLLLAFALSSFAQFPYDILGPKPKGKIDSVITPSGQGTTIDIFNKKGQLVGFDEYIFDQNPDFNVQIHDTIKTVYEYDKKGLLSKSIRSNSWHCTGVKPSYITDTTTWHFVKAGDFYIAKFGVSAQQKIYKLNSSFKLIEETDSTTYIDKRTNTYDKNGYLVKFVETWKRPDNTLLTVETNYKTDAEGNLKEKATKHLTFHFTYTTYDKMHNWLVRSTYRLNPEEMEDDFIGKIERRITYYK